jgi:hypothetical protein
MSAHDQNRTLILFAVPSPVNIAADMRVSGQIERNKVRANGTTPAPAFL